MVGTAVDLPAGRGPLVHLAAIHTHRAVLVKEQAVEAHDKK
jgi:hypothetical protein